MWPWPLTSKINRVHLLTMADMYAKFDEKAHNALVSILFTTLFRNMSIMTLTSKINMVHPLVIVNMSAKFDKHTQRFSFYHVHRVKAWRTHSRTTEPQEHYNIPSARRCTEIIWLTWPCKMLLNIAHTNFTWCICFNYFGRPYHIQAMWPESEQLAETKRTPNALLSWMATWLKALFLIWPQDTCIKRGIKYTCKSVP